MSRESILCSIFIASFFPPTPFAQFWMKLIPPMLFSTLYIFYSRLSITVTQGSKTFHRAKKRQIKKMLENFLDGPKTNLIIFCYSIFFYAHLLHSNLLHKFLRYINLLNGIILFFFSAIFSEKLFCTSTKEKFFRKLSNFQWILSREKNGSS